MEMFKALIDLSTPGFLELFQLNESLYGVAASYSNRWLIHTNLNQQMYLQVTMYTTQMLQKIQSNFNNWWYELLYFGQWKL